MDLYFIQMSNFILQSATEEELKQVQEISSEQPLHIIKDTSIRFDSEGTICTDPFTMKEWVINETAKIEDEIDKLMKYYAPYISPDLMTALEKLRNTFIMTALRQNYLAIQVPIQLGRLNENMYYEFYKDGLKVKKCLDELT